MAIVGRLAVIVAALSVTGWSVVTPGLGIHYHHSRAQQSLPAAPAQWNKVAPLQPRAETTLTKQIYGYLPYWVSQNYLHYDLLTTIGIFDVTLNPDGSISNPNNFPAHWAATIDRAHRNGVRVEMVATCFGWYNIHQAITTGADSAIRNLVALALSAGVDGINMDFEDILYSDRDTMTRFIQRLSAACRQNGLSLTMATMPLDFSNAYNFPALAETTDGLFMMEYNFHWPGCPEAGPTAPLAGWTYYGNVHMSLMDYLSKIGNGSKLLFGLPYYGYEWPTLADTTHSRTSGYGSDLYYVNARPNAQTRGRRWDTEGFTPWYCYNSGGWRQGWYDDDTSLMLKYQEVHEHNLLGTGMWALGYDGARTELWAALRETFNRPRTAFSNGDCELWRKETLQVPSDTNLKPRGWYEGRRAQARIEPVIVRSGSRALKQLINTLGDAGPMASMIFQDVLTSPGVSYQFSGWARKNDGQGNRMKLTIQWFNNTHHIIREDSSPPLIQDDTAWVYLTTGPVSAPYGSVFARLGLQLRGSTGFGHWDDLTFSALEEPDVGVIRIVSPSGAIDSGTVITPACSVFNYGAGTLTYPVRMRIGTAYDRVTTALNHLPGTGLFLTFPAWSANAPRGFWVVTCSTELTGDAQPANDRKTAGCNLQVRDVGTVRVLAPANFIDSGATIVPTCSVANFGNTTESFLVRMKIGPFYDRSVAVTDLAPAVRVYVTFPFWSAQVPAGNYAFSCSTELNTDMVRSNDRVTGSLMVRITPDHDVGCTRIIAPVGTVDSGTVITPACSLYNFGTQFENYPVRFRIGSAYDTFVIVMNHAPATGYRVTFPEWIATVCGNYPVACSTELTGDREPANDLQTATITVTGSNPPAGWSRMADIPAGAKLKAVKAGGCLAYAHADSDPRPVGSSPRGSIYAFKGNGRYEFYSYDPATNSWTAKESIPAIGSTGKKKAVRKGASLSAPDRVYACKGNSTLEFWQYTPDPGAYPWKELTPVPAGARPVREGSGQTAVTINDTLYIYLLKGSGTQEFYRYNTVTGIWQSRADAPLGLSGRAWKNGSCLATDGTTIWALKGSYNELYVYHLAGDSWIPRASLPFNGRSGRKVKAKDGAGLAWADSRLYCLKGNNSSEFWLYDPEADAWRQLDNLPPGEGKPVKAGGALVAAGTSLYALKGNNTREFYHYGIPSTLFSSVTNDGIQTRTAGTPKLILQVSPNPFGTTTTIHYSLSQTGNIRLKLYDITGRSLATLSEGCCPPGWFSYPFARSVLPAGVYLLRLETGNTAATAKLIIE